MILGKSLQGVVDRVTELENYKVDKIIHSSNVTMNVNDYGSLMFEFKENLPDMRINPVAHTQVAKWLGIANSYYTKMLENKPDLLAENVNAWLKDIDRNYMFRSYIGGGHDIVRAIVSDRYKRIDNIDLLNGVILPEMENFDGLTVKSAEVTDKCMYLQIVSENIKSEIPEVGDVVQAGIFLGNSELGFMNWVIQFLVYTLACTNGMVSADSISGFRRKHIGQKITDVEVVNSESAEFVLEARNTFQTALSEGGIFNGLVNNLNKVSTSKPVIDIPATVSEIGKDYAVKQNEQNLIVDHFEKQRKKNQYGLLNAVTRTAQDLKSYDRAVELEQLGGKILNIPEKKWNIYAMAENLD